MAKYHINPSTGDVGACSATRGKCPFGSEDEHYTSADAAREAFESKQTKPNFDYKWTPTDVKNAVKKDTRLRGKTVEEVADNLRADYRAVVGVPDLDRLSTIDKYASRNSDTDPDDFYVTFDEHAGGQWKMTIQYSNYDDTEGPLDPATLNADSHDYDYDNDGWGYGETAVNHTYIFTLSQADAEQARKSAQRRSLQDKYDQLASGAYPDWIVLPASIRRPLYPMARSASAESRARADLDRAEKSLINAGKAGSKASVHATKIKNLQNDKKELQDVLSKLSAGRARKAILGEQKVVESELAAAEARERRASNSASAANIKKLQDKRDIAKITHDGAKADLDKELKAYAVKKLAAHHPSTNASRSTSQAKEWIKLHPEVVEEIAKRDRLVR